MGKSTTVDGALQLVLSCVLTVLARRAGCFTDDPPTILICIQLIAARDLPSDQSIL